MGVVYSPDSPYIKEQEKWNTPKRLGGMNCNGYEPYPRMLYKAFPNEKGKVMCGDNPLAYRTDQGALDAEAFTRRCQLTVESAEEEATAKRQGWRNHPDEAIAFYEQQAKEQADITARRHFQDRRLSRQAQAEAKAADEATHEHVADVPAPPRKGRPRKTVSH